MTLVTLGQGKRVARPISNPEFRILPPLRLRCRKSFSAGDRQASPNLEFKRRAVPLLKEYFELLLASGRTTFSHQI